MLTIYSVSCVEWQHFTVEKTVKSVLTDLKHSLSSSIRLQIYSERHLTLYHAVCYVYVHGNLVLQIIIF